MNIEELLDHLLIPRPNGSAGLVQVASIIEAELRKHTAQVSLQTFTATPYGLQLLMGFSLVLMVGVAAAMGTSRFALALVLLVLGSTISLVESEWLRSPVSGLLPARETNVVGLFPGSEQGPTIIFSAHYDTATQFGDHFAWSFWVAVLSIALPVTFCIGLLGLWRQRQGRSLPRAVLIPLLALLLLPSMMMAWFFTAGPALRAPSPGALDNGGSVAVLLKLAQQLATRPRDSATTVKLVFFAGEEERALGSWRFAEGVDRGSPTAVINLETIGASEQLGYVVEEGFLLRRYHPPGGLVRLLEDVARDATRQTIVPVALPRGAMTDARSFLAQGIPAITLLGAVEGRLPRRLHSAGDSRDRLSITALERAVDLLAAVVTHVEQDPADLATLAEGDAAPNSVLRLSNPGSWTAKSPSVP